MKYTNTILGSWLYTDNTGPGGTTISLIFLPDNTYIMAHDGSIAADPTGQPGIEHGAYTWNQSIGTFSIDHSSLVDTNGEWGASHTNGLNMHVAGDTLTIKSVGEPNTKMTRVLEMANSIVGSWIATNNTKLADGSVSLVFLSDGTYIMANDETADPDGQDGIEHGTYIWDQASGAITTTTPVDTNGQWGLSHSQSPTMHVVGDTLTITSIGEADTTMTRVMDTYIQGGEGIDILLGGKGDDVISGAAGNDKIMASDGNDTLSGGAGNDNLDSGSGSNTISGGDGNDIITAGKGLSLSSGTNTLSGDAGNDKITGGSGEDALNGGEGNDVLSGGAGNDKLDGGSGNDKLTGGQGNDTYLINDLNVAGTKAADTVAESVNQGSDTVFSTISYTLNANVENLTLDGTDDIDGTGNKSANILTGNSGDNTLNGREGNDILTGGAGNDILLFNTKLTTHNDGTVVIPTNVDTVTDFKNGGDLDVLFLSKKIFTKAVADVTDMLSTDGLALDVNDLVQGSSLDDAYAIRAGSTANAHFLYDNSAQALYYDADGSGAKDAVQFATLTGVATLVASDLHIV
jgi:Ca2+-binding RTX toxin-like protein